MYKLLCVILSFTMVFCAIIVPEEQVSVKKKERIGKCVQHLINNITSPDHVVMHFYCRKNTFSLETIQNPKIVIDMMKKRIFNTKNYKTYMKMIILDLQYFFEMKHFVDIILKYKTFHDPNAILRKKYLIIIPNMDIDELKQIFYELFHTAEIIDIIVMTHNRSSNNTPINLFKMNPYNPANKCGEVITALEEYTCDTIHTIKNPGILDKYGKCTLTYALLNSPHYFNTVTELAYVEYFLINIITKTLNLTLNRRIMSKIIIHNGRFLITTIILRLFTEEDRPCSLPFYKDDWMWIVPSANRIDPMDVFKIIFQPIVWYSILLTFIVTSIVWWLISKSVRASDFLSAVVNVYSATLFGCVHKLLSPFKVRILFIAYFIYVLPIQTMFTSSLVRLFTVPQYERNIKNLEDLAYSELPVITTDTMEKFVKYIENDNTIYNRIKNKLLFLDEKVVETNIKNIDVHKNYTIVLLQSLLHHLQFIFDIPDPESFSDNSLVGLELFSFAITPKPLLLASVNKIIEILLETGQIDHQMNLYKQLRKGQIFAPNQVSDEKIVLTLEHVYPVFAYWGIGLIFATFVFILELLIHHKCCKK